MLPTSTGVGGAPPPPDTADGVEVGDWVGAGLLLLPFPAAPMPLDGEVDINVEPEENGWDVEDGKSIVDMEGLRDEVSLEDEAILVRSVVAVEEGEKLLRSVDRAEYALEAVDMDSEAVKLWRDIAASVDDSAVEVDLDDPVALGISELLSDVCDCADVDFDTVES